MEQYFFADGPAETNTITKVGARCFVVKLTIEDKVDIFHGFFALVVGRLALLQLKQKGPIYDELESVDREQFEDGVLHLELALGQIRPVVPLKLLLGESLNESIHFSIDLALVYLADVVLEGQT